MDTLFCPSGIYAFKLLLSYTSLRRGPVDNPEGVCLRGDLLYIFPVLEWRIHVKIQDKYRLCSLNLRYGSLIS